MPSRSGSPYAGQNSLISDQARADLGRHLLRGLAAVAGRRALDQPGDRPGLRPQRHGRRRRLRQRRGLQARRELSLHAPAAGIHPSNHRSGRRDREGGSRQPTSLPVRRPPTGWSSRSGSSRSWTSSTPTNMRTMRGPTSSIGRSSIPERSTTPPTHGASPMARRWNGTRAPGRSVAGCSISRSCPTAPSWTPASSRCNGWARSSAATSSRASPASSPSRAS